MRIGELSRKSGMSADTIRYYEAQKLLPPPQRAASGYRHFDADDLRRLNFIRRAKHLGFTLSEIAELLSLSAERDGDMATIKDSVEQKLQDIDRRLAELNRMRSALEALRTECPGHGPMHDCPILVAMGGDPS